MVSRLWSYTEPLLSGKHLHPIKCSTRANGRRELEQRLGQVEQRVLLTYQKTDSIERALRHWSKIVNKTLLEIAKAVGIPLLYRDGAIGLQPSYTDGAFMNFTTPGEGPVTN